MTTHTHIAKESAMEAGSRKAADFGSFEDKLNMPRLSRSSMKYLDKATSLLGSKNPFGKKAKPDEHEIWLLDNTAYRPINKHTGELEPWHAEFVAAYFVKGREDITSAVSNIADLVGLDKDGIGSHPEARKVIEDRLEPFVQAIAPARSCEVVIPNLKPNAQPHTRQLGPSDSSGISSQLLLTGGQEDSNGKSVKCSVQGFDGVQNTLNFAGPEGWLICSDIDDTIKKTMTPDPLGVLKSTFVEDPVAIKGMSELYKILQEQFNPAWFYLSASPYNLYPFLHKFIGDHFVPGTIILRDASWMFFSGFLQSLTEGVQEYKTDRLEKIHGWLPRRKTILIGDSTQSDSESYGAIYRANPDWVKAIYIRKVTDAPFMEKKNKDERFTSAFKDVPDHVWKVFVDPFEIADHVKHIAG